MCTGDFHEALKVTKITAIYKSRKTTDLKNVEKVIKKRLIDCTKKSLLYDTYQYGFHQNSIHNIYFGRTTRKQICGGDIC